MPEEHGALKLKVPTSADYSPGQADVPRAFREFADSVATRFTDTAGKFLIAQPSDVAKFVAMSGDVTINSSGVAQIGAGKIFPGNLSAGAVVEAGVADAAVTSRKVKPTAGVKMLNANYTLTNAATALTMAGGNLEITPAVPSRLFVWSFWTPEYSKLETGSYFTGNIQSGGGEVVVELPAPEVRAPWTLALPGTLAATHVCALSEPGKKYPIKMLARTGNAGDSGKLVAANTGFTYMLIAA